MEKIISNADVLYEIFQYLNLMDLLNLTQICTQFRTVIVDCVWKNRYKSLEVYKTPQYFGMLLTNNKAVSDAGYKVTFESVKEEKIILKKGDVNTFLQLIINNINMLSLYTPPISFYRSEAEKSGTKRDSLIFNPIEYGIPFDNKNRFNNLTTISFTRVIITEKDLRLVNINCRNLEKICFNDCYNTDETSMVIGDDIKITTIQNMNRLKHLEISLTNAVGDKDFYNIYEILSELNMIHLVIEIRNFDVIKEDEDNEVVGKFKTTLSLPSACEELTIAYFRSQRIFRKFESLNLWNFRNLKKLDMQSWVVVSVNENFFINLNKTCGQLEHLKLYHFEFNGFATISTVHTLILRSCSGLVWNDLKMILSNMKLKSFSFLHTVFDGTFEYFDVSPSLENINITSSKRSHLRELLDRNEGKNLENIKSLTWQDNYSRVPSHVTKSCIKLKILIVEKTSQLINNLHSLMFLEELTLKTFKKLKFSQIIFILKHPTLKHFSLINSERMHPNSYEDESDFNINYVGHEQELKEFEEKKINLTFLNITLISYLKISNDFWFNLLRNNPALTIMMRYDRIQYSDHLFLIEIINHQNFPRRLNAIKICGYRMEIQDFKDDFDTAIEKIKAFSSLYKDKLRLGYVVL